MQGSVTYPAKVSYLEGTGQHQIKLPKWLEIIICTVWQRAELTQKIVPCPQRKRVQWVPYFIFGIKLLPTTLIY